MHREELKKELLDDYFRDLAKEFRRENGKHARAEVVLIGGAAILAKHSFRQATTDVDALIISNASLKNAINKVGDKYNLENGWLNDGFKHTSSYTDKIVLHSNHYKTFSNVLNVRTVDSEYLIAMKLMAGRVYKYDKSDVIGVLMESKEQGKQIGLGEAIRAVKELYGEDAKLPTDSAQFLKDVLNHDNLSELYEETRAYERLNKESLLEIGNETPEWFIGDEDIEGLIRKKQELAPKYIGIKTNDKHQLIVITTNEEQILDSQADIYKIMHDIERNNPDYEISSKTHQAIKMHTNLQNRHRSNQSDVGL